MGFDLEDVPAGLRPAVSAALSASGLASGHLAVELATEERIRDLNRAHRGTDAPTDVLSFPIDGAATSAGPRELGDVVICAAMCGGDPGSGLGSVTEAAVHGVLHLCGHDHETDDGEMLELQRRVLSRLGDGSGKAVPGVDR